MSTLYLIEFNFLYIISPYFSLLTNVSPGAPFRSRISSGIQRFIDAGLITMWMDEVILSQVRKEQQASNERGVEQLTLTTVIIFFVFQINCKDL